MPRQQWLFHSHKRSVSNVHLPPSTLLNLSVNKINFLGFCERVYNSNVLLDQPTVFPKKKDSFLLLASIQWWTTGQPTVQLPAE